MQEVLQEPNSVEIDSLEVEERFAEIAAQLGEDSDLVSSVEIAELERTPVLKPAGTHDQGYKFN